MKIGILCPAEIAYRKFMPAMQKIKEIEYVGVATYSMQERFGNHVCETNEMRAIVRNGRWKGENFIQTYGGKLFKSYEALISSDLIDAVYIPLPPALHYKWSKKALEHGKHVMVEKPATTEYSKTNELVDVAKEKKLFLFENYMFAFHDQLTDIKEQISCGVIGKARLFRISFGFPKRGNNDFRYHKAMGGGALLDAGGYTIKLAQMILGEQTRVSDAILNYETGEEVDIFGAGTLKNNQGQTVQVAFGMDNEYKCELEIWGNKGTLSSGRVLTAPAGFVPKARVVNAGKVREIELRSDDAFLKSISAFHEGVKDLQVRNEYFRQMLSLAKLVDDFHLRGALDG